MGTKNGEPLNQRRDHSVLVGGQHVVPFSATAGSWLLVQQTWSTPAIPESVGRLRHAVAHFASEMGVPDPPLASVRLAVSEAVTNVVIHSYREQSTPGDVEVNAEIRSDGLHITVADSGLGFGPRVDSPGAGFGLPILEQVTDGLEVRNREPSGAEFRFWFKLPG